MIHLLIRHEIVGIVKEVGSNINRFKIGDHVGVGTYVNSCRECEYCNDRQEGYCAKGATFTFNALDVDGTITKGGYSDHIVVHDRQVISVSMPNLHSVLCFLILEFPHHYITIIVFNGYIINITTIIFIVIIIIMKIIDMCRSCPLF